MATRRRQTGASSARGFKSFGGSTTFLGLSDTPANYTGSASKFLTVNVGETALEFTTLPPIAITDTFVVNSQVAMLALTAQVGDVAVRTDISQSFILQVDPPTVLANWVMLLVSPTHDLGGALHNADTITNLNLKLSDGDLISNKAAEISALTVKATPLTTDLLMIESAADSNAKRKITIATLPAAAPAAHDLAGALHNADTITNLNLKLSDGDILSNKSAEFDAFTSKTTPVAADILAIEDSAATNAKKKIAFSDTMKMSAILEPGGTTTYVPFYYGTGSPPSATGKTDGTLFFKYVP